MRLLKIAFCAGLLATTLATLPVAQANKVEQVDLAAMTNAAARVFRGTVMDVRPGKVSVGGGQLDTTIYRIRVNEAFKGEFATFKDITYADVEMVGGMKAAVDTGSVRHLSVFRDVPRLELGGEYMLFMTRESRIALSSPVGLGQGTFEIDASAPGEPTVNRANNAGLVADVAKGPLPYANMAARVRALVAAKKGDQK